MDSCLVMLSAAHGYFQQASNFAAKRALRNDKGDFRQRDQLAAEFGGHE